MDKHLQPAPPEVVDRIQRLIAAHHPHLAGARIELQMRDTALMSDGSITFGEVDTPDDKGEERQFDFTLWFAADAWQGLNEVQRDALCDHELHHCGWDEEGKPFLLVHDVGDFNAVIARYGLWWPGAIETLRALKTMPPYLADQGRALAYVESNREGSTQMSQGVGRYQLPMQGFTSRGGYQVPQPGFTSRGGYQMPQPGFTSRGGFQGAQPGFTSRGGFSDAHLQEGGDYHTIQLPDGTVLELCPECYQAVIAAVLNDLQGAMGT